VTVTDEDEDTRDDEGGEQRGEHGGSSLKVAAI
jgi:hypothetical protein